MLNTPPYLIFSGDYRISRQRSITLQALLGTCVGVVIVDPANGIGGLIHLMLSKPASCDPPDPDERMKYAATGLPRFIHELCRAGARKEYLRAVVAGGALICPLSTTDLALDIGGRTTDTVFNILKSEDIPVEAAQTGGFFTYSLTLNMRTLEYAIDIAGAKKTSGASTCIRPTTEQIADNIKNLSPIPQVALKVLRLINGDAYDIESVSDEIRRDQVLCARTLQICNSAFFFNRHPVGSVDEAIIFLGQDMLAKLIVAVAVNKIFTPSSMGYSLCKGGLFYHAVGTALVSEELARITRRADPLTAYTAGLLHDIGKVVLDQSVEESYLVFYQHFQKQNRDVKGIEKELFGLDHTQIGGLLADKWALPGSLTHTIKFHHTPRQAPSDKDLVHIVYIADLIMTQFNAGLELERMKPRALADSLETLGLSITRFSEVIDAIPLKIFRSLTELADC